MSKKKYLRQLLSIKFTDRPTPIYGFILDYNNDWTLMKHNPFDYVIDGFIILRHKNIQGFRRDKEEKFKEKIINLKGYNPSTEEVIPLNSLETILSFLTNNFGAFQLETKSENACYIGNLKTIDNKNLIINSFNINAKWSGQVKLRVNDVRTIQFDNDYINSLRLLSTAGKQAKMKKSLIDITKNGM
jgi:hypothetical protein